MTTPEEMKNALEKTMKEQMDKLTQTMQNYTKETVEKAFNNQTSSKKSFDQMRDKIERKRKLEDVTLSNNGNKDQYRHGTEVLSTIEEAHEYLESNEVDLAKESIQKGKKIVENRLKLIRIADREGWLTVREFVSDELTATEEEEKRLKKAIRSANAIREKQNLKKAKAQDIKNTDRAPSQTDKRRMDDIICYNCKRAGHYIYNCPFEFNRESKKVPQSSSTSSSSSSDRKKEKYQEH